MIKLCFMSLNFWIKKIKKMKKINKRSSQKRKNKKIKRSDLEVSKTIDKFTKKDNFLEPELKPEFLEDLQKIRKGKYIKFNSVDELRKAIS